MNVFFQKFVSETIDYVLTTENSMMHDDILVNHEANKAHRQLSVAPVITESKEEK